MLKALVQLLWTCSLRMNINSERKRVKLKEKATILNQIMKMVVKKEFKTSEQFVH